MSDSLRPRFTITLGRNGQVVDRDVSYIGTGSKRSLRDRLGNDAGSSVLDGRQLNYKRPRGDDASASSASSHCLGDTHIRKDDLRYKLVQKNVTKRTHADHDKKIVDLSEELSKAIPLPRCSLDTQHYMPRSRETSVLSQIPSIRTVSNMTRMDSLRRSYSPWTFEHLRRSPEGVVGVSRNLSPQRNMNELERQQSLKPMDDVRPLQYMGSYVIGPSMTGSSSPYLTTSILSPGTAKPMVAPWGQLRLPSGLVQKSSYLADDQQTVDGLLNALGLGKYAILFKAEEIDMTALKQMGENDLKEIGIPMGPRKKILLALLPPNKHQP